MPVRSASVCCTASTLEAVGTGGGGASAEALAKWRLLGALALQSPRAWAPLSRVVT